MAIFRPNYRTTTVKGQKILYYSITAVIIIAAVILLLGPCNNEDKPAKPIKFETLPMQQEPELLPEPLPEPTEKAPLTTEQNHVLIDTNSTGNDKVLSLLQQAQDNIDKQKIIVARSILNDVFAMQLQPGVRENLRRKMTELAELWLFNRTTLIGDTLCGFYKVKPGDVFSIIGKEYKVPYEILMKINGITNPRSLQVGQTLKVVHGPFHAIVYRSAFLMDVYLQNTYVCSYKIGIGKEGKETPIGRWRVKPGGKLIKPTWTDPETNTTYTSDDPNYPLGSGYIALEGIEDKTKGISGIAIHGTKDEATISTRSSQGCIRLFNGDLIELFNLLEPGYSEVNILD